MKNAHERFGWLEFTRALKDTTVRVRLRVDGCIAEVAENGRVMDSFICSLLSAGILTLARHGQPFNKTRCSRSRERILRKRN